MVTRRTLLKQGVYATLSVATAPMLTARGAARSASPGQFDFYISPTGSDSNPGTYDRPWAITAINTRRNDYAGKRVGLLDGTYNVHSLCEAAPQNGVGLAVNGGSSAASPTVIAAVNVRKAILTGAEPSSGAYPTREAGIIGQGYLSVPNKGNVILDGLVLTRSWWAGTYFYPQLPAAAAKEPAEGGTTGIVVRNCEVYDIGGIVNNNVGGIKLNYVTGALITNNQIHGVQPNPGQAHPSNAAGIFSFHSHGNIYEYNTIYDCNCGIHDKNAQNGGHTHRYNFIEIAGAHPWTAMQDCSGGDAGDVLTVHNNILIAPVIWDGSGVAMPSKQSLLFYNNTCHGGQGGIWYPAGGSLVSPPAMVKFYNNLMYFENDGGWTGGVRFCTGAVALSNYNVYRASTASGGRTFGLSPAAAPRTAPTTYSLESWQKTTSMDGNSTTSAIAAGALFNAANKGDPASYALQASSVGRNMGRVGGTASGSPTDVGAWGGGPTRIGCDFGPSPRAPVLGIG